MKSFFYKVPYMGLFLLSFISAKIRIKQNANINNFFELIFKELLFFPEHNYKERYKLIKIKKLREIEKKCNIKISRKLFVSKQSFHSYKNFKSTVNDLLEMVLQDNPKYLKKGEILLTRNYILTGHNSIQNVIYEKEAIFLGNNSIAKFIPTQMNKKKNLSRIVSFGLVGCVFLKVKVKIKNEEIYFYYHFSTNLHYEKIMIESLKKNFVNNRNIKTLNISLISFKPFYYIDKFKKMNLKGKILIHNNNKKDLNIVIENNKSIYSFTGCSLNKKQLLRFKKI